jgi:hypothetical protein
MAAFVPVIVPVHRRSISVCLWLAAWSMAGALFLTGCDRDAGDHSRQFEGLRADIDEARRRVSSLQNSLASKDKELAVMTEALQTSRDEFNKVDERAKAMSIEAQAAKTELEAIKKKDSFVFGEIAATQGAGTSMLAITRYKKFIADYPKSPLVLHANNAIAQLTEVQKDVGHRPATVAAEEATKKDKDFQRNLSDGYVSLQDLAPYVRKKSVAQIVALLGRPNQTYNEGNEFGYVDKAINPSTGTRGMLIVSFDGGIVSSIRVEYAGRKMTP